MKFSFPFLLFIPLLLWQCKADEFKYPDRLHGEWIIERSERMQIFADGSVELFEDQENAGTLDIFEATPKAETFKEFTMSYSNFKGEEIFLHSFIYSDEAASRVMMSKILCDSPFECDIVWTVDTYKRGKQVWSAYGDAIKYFYPTDRFDPSNEEFHLKWRLTLRRK